MSEDQRSIELEVEVSGTPEEVWRAIATGPGISSWFVPHTVEERLGGAASASFGPEPEMQTSKRVAAWEPPHRVVFDGGEGMAFEWIVEARGDSSCVVRLVHTGFGSGEDWDDQYDAMTDGWKLFLVNLRLHLEHFSGQTATSMLPVATWAGPRELTWTRLTHELSIPPGPTVGEHLEVRTADGPALAGVAMDAAPWRLVLLLDRPAPGTAFVTVEGAGEEVSVSIWAYLYGADAAVLAERDAPLWGQWLGERAVPAPAA